MKKYQVDELLMHMSLYANMEDFDERSFTSFDEVLKQLEEGYIREISIGTYNGYTDTFTRAPLTAENLFTALLIELGEMGYYDRVYDACEESDETHQLKKWSDFDWVIDFLNMYEVFTIGDRIYLDIG